jgi:phage FluMu protein Com
VDDCPRCGEVPTIYVKIEEKSLIFKIEMQAVVKTPFRLKA